MKKRIISMILALCMVLSMLPVSAFAAEADGLCEHHTEHTSDCGYVAAAPGSDCTHVHVDTCGYVQAQEEVPCTYQCVESHGEPAEEPTEEPTEEPGDETPSAPAK